MAATKIYRSTFQEAVTAHIPKSDEATKCYNTFGDSSSWGDGTSSWRISILRSMQHEFCVNEAELPNPGTAVESFLIDILLILDVSEDTIKAAFVCALIHHRRAVRAGKVVCEPHVAGEGSDKKTTLNSLVRSRKSPDLKSESESPILSEDPLPSRQMCKSGNALRKQSVACNTSDISTTADECSPSNHFSHRFDNFTVDVHDLDIHCAEKTRTRSEVAFFMSPSDYYLTTDFSTNYFPSDQTPAWNVPNRNYRDEDAVEYHWQATRSALELAELSKSDCLIRQLTWMALLITYALPLIDDTVPRKISKLLHRKMGLLRVISHALFLNCEAADDEEENFEDDLASLEGEDPGENTIVDRKYIRDMFSTLTQMIIASRHWGVLQKAVQNVFPSPEALWETMNAESITYLKLVDYRLHIEEAEFTLVANSLGLAF